MCKQFEYSEKERIKAIFMAAAEREADSVAELLASTATGDLLGKTEFALRDAVLKLGAQTLEGAANERAKKKATMAAAPPVPAAGPIDL